MPVSSFFENCFSPYTTGMLFFARLQDTVIARLTPKHLLLYITLLAWALWFGATIAVFVFVKHYFAVFPHDQAGICANAMFNSFAKYELALAGISLMSTGLLMVSYPTVRWVLVLGCLILTSGMAVTVALGLIPMMDALLDQGKQHSPEFIKLHVKSMIAMSMQTGMLLLVGIMLITALDFPTPPAMNGKTEPDDLSMRFARRF
jgi:hypothetical protein